MASSAPVDGGSLKRGVALLKLLATAGARGLALTEIAGRAGLPHPSVHRVLQQLVAERLVVQLAETRRYRLGPLTFELGIASSTLHDLRDLCEPSMQQLARKTEDTVYLVLRSGFDAVCMHRVEGDFPIRTLVLDVGSRRPLGVGAGGLAILAAIDDAQREEVIARIGPSLKPFGNLTPAELEATCQRARERGAAVIEHRVTPGVAAVGLHFVDSMGQPVGALSVAALAQRMTPQRIGRTVQWLQMAVAEVERRLRLRQNVSVRRGEG